MYYASGRFFWRHVLYAYGIKQVYNEKNTLLNPENPWILKTDRKSVV